MSTVDSSGIDDAVPAAGGAYTANVRANFTVIKQQFDNAEIDLNTVEARLDTAETNISTNTTDIGTNAANHTNHLADTVDAHDASAISNVAAGGIAATDVQGAINELDTEKVPLAGGAMTGPLSNFSSTGIDDNADSVAITIGADESVTFTENINLSDNKYLYFGDSNDLQFVHNSTDSYLINNTGSLFIRELVNSGTIYLSSNDSGGTTKTGIIVGGATPDVKLHYNGVEKLKTTIGGVSIGVSDNTAGVIDVFGGATATTEGGQISLYTCADYDSTVDYFYIDVNTDILRIGGAGIGVGLQMNSSKEFNFLDNVVQRPEIKDYSIAHNAVSYVASLTLDYSTGQSFSTTLTGNVTTLTLSNPPATGKYGEIVWEVTQDATGGRTIAWPASVKWVGGTAPENTILSSIHKIYLSTRDGGTTWLGDYSEAYE